MRPSHTPVLKDLVLVGGGHSHVAVIKRFGMEPIPGVRMTVISRDVHAPYSGMLPGLIAGHYEFDEAHIDLAPLTRFADARLIHDEVVGIDLAARHVRFRARPPIAYDVLSINIGSSPSLEVPGAASAVTPVKPITGLAEAWRAIHRRCTEGSEARTLAVVGAGAAGVELTLAVQHRLRTDLVATGRDDAHLDYVLVSATPEILPSHNRRVRAKFGRILRERDVRVVTGHKVERVESPGNATVLHLEGGETVHADETLWVTQAAAQSWPGASGLEVDDDGFIAVRETLQTVTDPDVFAVGDIAAVLEHPRPKAGVFAVRQGPPLDRNLRARLVREEPTPFRPQREFLSLISTGDRYAVASRSSWALEGRWVWTWKDWIDRRFMNKYSELPEMAPERPRLPASGLADEAALQALATEAMRCGGCGAKVGSDVLERALARVDGGERDDVLTGLDGRDDAAVIAVPPGKVLVQSVDHFRAFIDDPFAFGEVAANHALGDIWAMGAVPQSALAVVTLPHAAEDKLEEDLVQLLGGAMAALRPAGAVLVGGHTGEGAELALGFAVNGLGDASALLGKGGLAVGQRLILTKPLGTGALFAAAMRGKARGRHVEEALRSMRRSGAAAAATLRAYGATAMTDVTGFGLIGHLLEMVRASEVGAAIETEAVPVLAGGVAAVERGITSSLQPQNVRLRRAIAASGELRDGPAFALLFDPQTAGGLLAGVPAGAVDACLRALHDDGDLAAACIGEVTKPADPLAPISLA